MLDRRNRAKVMTAIHAGGIHSYGSVTAFARSGTRVEAGVVFQDFHRPASRFQNGSAGLHQFQAELAGAVGAIRVGVIGPGSAVGQYDELFSGHPLPFLLGRLAG